MSSKRGAAERWWWGLWWYLAVVGGVGGELAQGGPRIRVAQRLRLLGVPAAALALAATHRLGWATQAAPPPPGAGGGDGSEEAAGPTRAAPPEARAWHDSDGSDRLRWTTRTAPTDCDGRLGRRPTD